jgi:hypothetical protein
VSGLIAASCSMVTTINTPPTVISKRGSMRLTTRPSRAMVIAEARAPGSISMPVWVAV